MMACHARHYPSVCVVQERWWNVLSYVIWSCVLSEGMDGIPRPTSSNHVSSPRAMMACMPYIVRLCALSKDNAGMPHPDFVWPCLLSKSDDGIPWSTLSHFEWFPRVMKTCLARHCSWVFSTRVWWHSKTHVIWPCVLSNSYDDMYARLRPTVWVVKRVWFHAIIDVARSCVLSKD